VRRAHSMVGSLGPRCRGAPRDEAMGLTIHVERSRAIAVVASSLSAGSTKVVGRKSYAATPCRSRIEPSVRASKSLRVISCVPGK